MKVLVIGGGGREHALVWKLRQSTRVSQVYCAPGNGGISDDAECLPLDVANLEAIVGVAHQVQPDLTVVGPEIPLQLGIVDEFTRKGLKIFGPTRAAAQLESSKAFAKQFMQRHSIPTAHFAVCTSDTEVNTVLSHFSLPIVVKADGLAAGKGVVICHTRDEAAQTASEMLSGKMLGEAGLRVVLEECLEGEELSFLVFSDGERVVPLAPARDHKRVGDQDTGPNTGGMGSYSSPGILEHEMSDWLIHHVAQPAVAGMKAEGAEYRGVLYCGMMMTAKGPVVLEFNCRFGDPETQPILMRMESDLIEAMEASIEGRVSPGDFRWSNDAAACVVVASGGYPGSYAVGKEITGLEKAGQVSGVKIFHAGTSKRDGKYFTAAGRVLAVSARAASVKSAVQRAYEAVRMINFEGVHYRRDIGSKVVES